MAPTTSRVSYLFILSIRTPKEVFRWPPSLPATFPSSLMPPILAIESPPFPRKLTYNLKSTLSKRKIIFRTSILGLHVCLRASSKIYQQHPSLETSKQKKECLRHLRVHCQGTTGLVSFTYLWYIQNLYKELTAASPLSVANWFLFIGTGGSYSSPSLR